METAGGWSRRVFDGLKWLGNGSTKFGQFCWMLHARYVVQYHLYEQQYVKLHMYTYDIPMYDIWYRYTVPLLWMHACYDSLWHIHSEKRHILPVWVVGSHVRRRSLMLHSPQVVQGARRGGGPMRVASIGSEAFKSRWIGWEIEGQKIHGTTSRFGNQ